MTDGLYLGDVGDEGFYLPLEAATRRLAVLGMSGSGKSNVAVVLAEGMYDAGIPWVCIDPKGDWWGIRSSGVGDVPGLPVPIFGGLHGDVPLEPGAGKLIGDLIVDQRLTCILDVSEFEQRQQMWDFLADLGDTLLRRNREALHLFLEEADEYIPQIAREGGNLARCLGVWQRVVKRGRFRGLGSCQISQRSAALNKDAFYQAELLIALRATGKRDREAVRGWVDYANASQEIVDSLPTLEDGEGWVSSPAWLRRTERVRFIRRRTFDSGSTPVLLDAKRPPATLADVDLEQLRMRMAETIERAEAEDPKKLQARIRQLERDIARDKRQKPAEPVAADSKELEILRDTIGEKDAVIEELRRDLFYAVDYGQRQAAALDAIRKGLGDTAIEVDRALNRPEPKSPAPAASPAVKPTPSPPRQAEPRAVRESAARLASEPAGAGQEELTGPERRILDAIAWLQVLGIEEPEQPAVAFLAGYTYGGGAFNNPKGKLRGKGLVRYLGDRIALTDAGAALTNVPDEAPTNEELHERVLARINGPMRRLLRPLLDAYPNALTDEELAAAADYTAGAGSFNNPKGRLRSLGLIDYPASRMAVAKELLFPEGVLA